ncbi:hypothetical protein BJ508DRAFT_375505 [Ascobolus immersus RN42]|uniref:Transposase Tc1-like domain-containing protein n=1 Tax=Ascobolus immersus RN42 TaxID=1160509 RepID=A0A3N4IMB5_ASCIM|nr:hypothetical protein BJ508DRAFT_375505 [Ascobolus immersus RN42]
MLSFTDLLNSPLEGYDAQTPTRGRELHPDESDSESEPEPDNIPGQPPRPPSPSPAPRPRSSSTSSTSTTSQPRKRLTRDQRRDIQLMRSLGYTQVDTAKAVGVTTRAVQYTDQVGYATPKKRTGRPPKLGPAEVEELVAYVTASAENRQKSYQELAVEFQDHWPHLEVGYYSIKYALKIAGFSRRKALKKPKIDADCAAKRLEFALSHVHWSEEDWMQILWSDETWVGAGQHRRIYVTLIYWGFGQNSSPKVYVYTLTALQNAKYEIKGYTATYNAVKMSRRYASLAYVFINA